MEAHYRIQKVCREKKIPLTIINPGTLIGDSKQGEISLTQGDGILSLMEQIIAGKMLAIPGKINDWLPMVTVDYLAAFMAGICELENTDGQAYWVIDERTPPFHEIIKTMAEILKIKAPKFHLPIWMMKLSLRLGLSKLMNLSYEGLEYIISNRFNVGDENDLARQMGIKRPDIMDSLCKTVLFYKEYLMYKKQGHVTTNQNPLNQSPRPL